MMEKTTIISHIRTTDKLVQDNSEHSLGVATLAATFAKEFNMEDWGYYMGMLHDKGKEKHDFQTYIRLMNDLPTRTKSYQDKTHAYVGALLARKTFPTGYPFVAYALAGHHAGMPDYLKLEELLKKPMPEEISQNQLPQAPTPPTFLRQMKPKDINHLFRMLYSCLVDADYLDTERFMNEEQSQQRGNSNSLSELLPLLEAHLHTISQQSEKTPVNKIRQDVQVACRNAANLPQGVYSLTVPTGGGKTLSSILWAMLHAIKNNKKRIILSIPYTSIITQTAAILKAIFGDENVLEYHSNIQENNPHEADETSLSKKLAAENWDFPIIVTTNVQLLESMYASHPAACRKLHNVVNSVLLFDEVQTLPGERLQPIIDALQTYHQFFGVSILFTTASQPTLEGERPGHHGNLQGFEHIHEIIPNSWKLHEKLKRVELHFRDDAMDYDAIAEQLLQHHRVLCIVNTRKDAGEIFTRMESPDEGALHFHLSRMMCAEHLDSTLQQIKETLIQDNKMPIRVVSTQLVEAGVDFDFPVVYRQEAGLDSILQAAGRCNREGKLKELGQTEVFKINGRRVPPGTLTFANQARLNMPVPDDWFSPKAMADYFTHFYHQIPTFDKKVTINGAQWNMNEALYSIKQMMFDTANQIFRLIENDGKRVVVNYGNSPQLIEQLRAGIINKQLFRKLNRYAVNLHERDFLNLFKTGMIEKVQGIYYLCDKHQYDERVGLMLDNHWIEETLIL